MSLLFNISVFYFGPSAYYSYGYLATESYQDSNAVTYPSTSGYYKNYDINADRKIKFKNPVNFAYTFSVELNENAEPNIRNFNIGFLNQIRDCPYSQDLKAVILEFMMNPACGTKDESKSLNLNVV